MKCGALGPFQLFYILHNCSTNLKKIPMTKKNLLWSTYDMPVGSRKRNKISAVLDLTY